MWGRRPRLQRISGPTMWGRRFRLPNTTTSHQPGYPLGPASRVERRSERLGLNCVERCDDLRPLLRTQDADALQSPRECLRTPDIGVDQPAVEFQRSAETLEHLARPGFKPPTPELHFGLLIRMSLG